MRLGTHNYTVKSQHVVIMSISLACCHLNSFLAIIRLIDEEVGCMNVDTK